MYALSHEQPLLLVLRPEVRVEAALPEFLGSPGIRHVALPTLWTLDKAGLDLPTALPACREVHLGTLEEVIGTLLRLCDAEALDALVARSWRSADERVRQYYLQLGIGKSLATIFKLGTPSVDRPPPPDFRRDRIHENGFEMQYRLARSDEEGDGRTAPQEEGSVVLYPFDPSNEEARAEADLGEGRGAVLEVFAYEFGRERHLEFWQGLGSSLGFQVVDPRD
jgi:hypothetical protein